ncbi:4-hydroxyphenylacetate degradation bifunctional isomerase/decarboxylase [Chlamydia trachomatis]|nr:4-hydroxyphenylacetate degradation bifunctional isomerase/decarboxylase [Chlamydia trachomatis]
MIFGIADLIEYFSSFMTLSPNDIILTGTPEGLADTAVGDEIITEIEGIGKLVSTIVGDDVFTENGDRPHLKIHK